MPWESLDNFSLRVPSVVPFKDDIWILDGLVDDETKEELRMSGEALNRVEAYEKKLIGFDPPIE